MTGVTEKTGAEFSVTAVTTVTKASVQPFEALCAAFDRQTGKSPQLEKSATFGLCGPNRRKLPALRKTDRATGTENGPSLDGASIAFVWTWGEAPALPNTVFRAEARTHFENGGHR